MMPQIPVAGTEDIPERLFGRIDFACPVCGESGNHICIQGFKMLMEVDEIFAAAVAKTYLQMKYAGILSVSIEEMAGEIEDAMDAADREDEKRERSAKGKASANKKSGRTSGRKKGRATSDGRGNSSRPGQ